MESRTKNSIRNIIYGCTNKIITIILPFIARTIIIQVLGTEYLGLNSLFTSILQVLNLAELGFGNALVYSMYKPIAEKDNNKVCQLLNYYKKCYRIIGIIVLIIGLLLLPFLDNLIAGQHPEDINIYYIYMIYLVNTTLSYFLFAYKSSLLIANQRNDISSKISLILIVLQNLVQILFLILLKNYYYYIIVLPFITVLNNLVTSRIVDKRYPQYKEEKQAETLQEAERKEIKKNVKGMFFQKIGTIVLNNVDNIVISAFLGLVVLGLYNNYYYIITSLFGILTVIMNSLKASVGNSIILESKEKNYNDFSKFNFLYVWVISWMSICLLCLMQNFVELWLGKEYLLDNSIIILFAIYFFVHKWCDMLYVYQEARGLWWENRYIPFTAAIVNLVTNIILVNTIGLPGILISTIVSVVFIDDLGYAVILFKKYFNIKGKLREYLLKQIKYLTVTVIIGLFSYAICSKMNNTVSSFIIKMMLVTVIPNLLFYIFYRKSEEFNESIAFIKKRLIKR